MRIREVAAVTDMGPKRRVNEDAILNAPDLPLFAVVDGTGGPQVGKFVCRVLEQAGDVLRRHGRRVRRDGSTASRIAVGQFFEKAFEKVSEAIQEERSRTGGQTMGASVVAATVLGQLGYVSHVGDTRAYLLRDRKLRRLTADHTLAMLQLQRGEITEDEFEGSPFKHTLSQALGVTPRLEVDTAEIRLQDGDVLVLCSNGLTRSIPDDYLQGLLLQPGLQRAARGVIDAARARGARDNATIVLVEVGAEEDDERTAPATANAVDTVRKVFLFRLLTEPQWLAVAPFIEEHTFEDGDVIYDAGDEGDRFYILGRGRVRVRAEGLKVRELGPGGTFGELALAAPYRRQESVSSVGRTVAFSISRASFRHLVNQKPVLGSRLALGLIRGLGDRVVALNGSIAKVRRAMSQLG